MRRATVRLFALVVLALLGAPVAIHVVMHDLHVHHDEQPGTYVEPTRHGDHEHPIVSSAAPQVPSSTRVALPVATASVAISATWTSIATTDRNVRSLGALRTDNDVGLQPLLSTFVI